MTDAERIEALEAKCALLSAALKRAGREALEAAAANCEAEAERWLDDAAKNGDSSSIKEGKVYALRNAAEDIRSLKVGED